MQAYVSKDSADWFVRNGIFSHKEQEARTEIRYETYVLRLQIEGRILNEMVNSYVLPSAINYQKRLADSVATLNSIGVSNEAGKIQRVIIEQLGDLINRLYTLNESMTGERAKANNLEHADEKALAYCNSVKPMFDEIRECCDEIERIVDDSEWNLPKYRELLNLA